ncbi:hypothetical protein EVAR_101651_1 [Eumeta japonica]|uniref:Uncharacterized protein n=1 Tax=Eumeta variegata TaxID=151549 RepID=A0A4C1TDW9_EUMVA|nr:hypothetical protein EVAR_101651_1 [Eumeta japonica]
MGKRTCLRLLFNVKDKLAIKRMRKEGEIGKIQRVRTTDRRVQAYNIGGKEINKKYIGEQASLRFRPYFTEPPTNGSIKANQAEKNFPLSGSVEI